MFLHKEPRQVVPRKDWLILLATSLNVVLVFICASSITVILPTLSNDFAATPAESTWFVLSYLMVMTALIIVVGRAADIVGRKRLYIVGVAVFAVGSALSGAAGGAEVFIAARLIQGVGAAAIVANTTAILTDVFRPAALSVALGLNATSAALGQVLGPLIGGVLAQFDGWRFIFWGAAALSLLSLAVSVGLIPAVEKKPHERMDYVGAIIFAAALALFVSAMSLGPASAWSNPWDYAMILGSLILAGVFTFAQRRVREPLVDFNLFRVPGLRAGYVSVFLAGFSHFAVILLLSQYLQGVESAEPIDVSLLVASSPFATMCAAVLAGRLARTVPVRLLTSVGMVCIGMAPLSLIVLIQYDAVLDFGYLSFVSMGLGIGLFMTPNTSSIMALSPSARRGISNAVRSTMLNLSMLMTNAIGLALSTMFLPQSGRTAVYAGNFPVLGAHAGAFTTGIQVALGVMGISALAGLIVCLRRKDIPSNPPNRETGGRSDGRAEGRADAARGTLAGLK